MRQTLQSGFSFDLCKRNEQIAAASTTGQPKYDPFKPTKTGTTIVGLIYKDGVVLGADTRATSGPIVADKNCSKIHYIAPNIYCCGAGTAADTENVTRVLASTLQLQRLNSDEKRPSRIVTAMTQLKQKLFNYQGHLGAALIVGGVDVNGPQVYAVHPHGSTDKLPYVTMGSGSLCAMAVFEAKYRQGMNRQEAIDLVTEAIESGIFNDLGSGSNVDVTVISNGTSPDSDVQVEILRNYRKGNEKPTLNKDYRFERGSTAVVESETLEFGSVVSLLEREIINLAAGRDSVAHMETE